MQIHPLVLVILVLPAVLAVLTDTNATSTCVFTLVIIRHGEKPADPNDVTLTIDGKHRAQYIANCASNHTSVLSPPNFLVASYKAGKSERSKETLEPISSVLGVSLDSDLAKDDYTGFVQLLQKSQKCGATMLAAWEHTDIAGIIAALKPPNAKDYSVWPSSCDSETWKEPSYIDPSDSCYDRMLRIQFTGSDFQIGNVETFQEGFGGEASSPCSEGLTPSTFDFVNITTY